jgi:hypothetical protein
VTLRYGRRSQVNLHFVKYEILTFRVFVFSVCFVVEVFEKPERSDSFSVSVYSVVTLKAITTEHTEEEENTERSRLSAFSAFGACR